MPAHRLRNLTTVVLTALLTVTAGCSTGSAPAAEAAGRPRSGGTLTWAIETEPVTLNPHQYAQAKARLLVWNTFESLLTYDQQGKLVPWLATGWQAAPDGRSYTLTLRDKVAFSDGTPFDATAVKANIDKLRERAVTEIVSLSGPKQTCRARFR
ncbi:ABC transporter substrate-binding protein [Micromonospora sp. CPCC 206060]|uniref:ABC transporter substrate-binding protein n=1 Tax=Micromonospora sp. CPCC 206060 TaxID=3122406 RepID=UPI002FF1ECB0